MCVTNAMGFFNINWQMPYAGILLIAFTFFIALGYAVLWFYWQGRNWARWLVLLECLQCFWNVKYLFHRHPLAPRIEPAMIASEAILALYLIWYLNKPEVRTWFQTKRTQPPPSIITAT
jgi:hypothetical protein